LVHWRFLLQLSLFMPELDRERPEVRAETALALADVIERHLTEPSWQIYLRLWGDRGGNIVGSFLTFLRRGGFTIIERQAMTKLGLFFRDRRLAKGMKVSDLARLIGYQNISHGSQRIHDLERVGVGDPALVTKVAGALGVPEAEYQPLQRDDQQERMKDWAAWVNEPIRPYFIVRQMAAMYQPRPLPSWILAQEHAEKYVADIARQLRLRCCLVWSRRLSIFYSADGMVENVQEAVFGQDNAPGQRGL
jgi:transcriptional regulator with XRE-family HTH domain